MNKTKEIVISLCFLVFGAIIIHHFFVCGRLFDLADILHHEWFAVTFLAFGVGLTVGDLME